MLSFSFIVSLEKNHFFFMGSDPEYLTTCDLFLLSRVVSSHLSRPYKRCLLLTTERCVIHSSSVGSYRSPCFVYNFFRNVYFFFMGSDPNVVPSTTTLQQSTSSRRRLSLSTIENHRSKTIISRNIWLKKILILQLHLTEKKLIKMQTL